MKLEKAALAVGHHGAALRFPDGLAEIRLAREADFALAAFRDIKRDDVLADLEAAHVGADFHDDASAFVTQHAGEDAFRVFA